MDDVRRNFFEQNLIKEGCELEIDTVQEGTKKFLNFVKIHIPFRLLAREAELLKIKTPLKVADPMAIPKLGPPDQYVIFWPFERSMYKKMGHYEKEEHHVGLAKTPMHNSTTYGEFFVGEFTGFLKTNYCDFSTKKTSIIILSMVLKICLFIKYSIW